MDSGTFWSRVDRDLLVNAFADKVHSSRPSDLAEARKLSSLPRSEDAQSCASAQSRAFALASAETVTSPQVDVLIY